MEPTIKVYKGAKSVLIYKKDLEEWRERGFKTSSDRAKASKVKKEDEK